MLAVPEAMSVHQHHTQLQPWLPAWPQPRLRCHTCTACGSGPWSHQELSSIEAVHARAKIAQQPSSSNNRHQCTAAKPSGYYVVRIVSTLPKAWTYCRVVQVQARRTSPRMTEPFALPPDSMPTCIAPDLAQHSFTASSMTTKHFSRASLCRKQLGRIRNVAARLRHLLHPLPFPHASPCSDAQPQTWGRNRPQQRSLARHPLQE